jgi:murein DD-endopeptidase MepM/ murein hydrolase activator NlpD
MTGRRARYGNRREGVWRGRMWLVLALGLVGGLGVLGWVKCEWHRPTVELVQPHPVLGLDATITVRLRDRGTGLAWSRVELEAPATHLVLASADYPATSWRGSTTFETTLSIPLTPRDRKIPEGPATLRVFADDYSWLRWVRSRGPLLEQTLTIDLTPPTVEVLSQQHYVSVGGVDLVLYRPSADSVRSGIVVGPYFFPGTAGLFDDVAITAAFFAIPHDLDSSIRPQVVAEDAAGNRRAVSFHVVIKPRHFAVKTIEISDEFLARKVPEILAASGLPNEPDLLKGYLYINRTLRQMNEARIREVTRTSAPRMLWEGPFLRQPNSAPSSGFADRRTYVYHGEKIDAQTHLGFDLASVRQAEVVAVNTGKIVFAGPLGIYGDAVIIDHGLGIFSLYGHLSAITVAVGDDVTRGATIGRTGETGLAGGDHLHFSTMLYGIHVDPVEWWDGKWIHDHVLAKFDAYPHATVAARSEP